MLKELENQINNNIKEGDKITIGFINSFGMQTLVKGTFHSVEIKPYAQYKETLLITLKPYRKRQYFQYRIRPQQHLTIWEGWYNLEKYNEITEHGEGYTMTSSKFVACDIEYFENLYQYVKPLIIYNTKQDEINRYIIKDQNIISELEAVAKANNNRINENIFNIYGLTPRHIIETFKGKYYPELNY